MPGEQQGPFGEPTGDISGIDADALMNQVESSPGERQMSAEPAQAPQGTQAPAATQTPSQAAAAEYAFTHGGKEIKISPTDPRHTQWLSQGYDYAQRMAAFNQQQKDFQTRQAKVTEYESRYQPVEKYIEQNPDWWKHVNEQYQTAKQAGQPGLGLDPNNPIAQKLSAYEQELSGVKEFIASQQAKESQAQAQQEDAALTQEIQSIRDSYKDLDWQTPDQSGKTLEMKVLEHASENGFKKFGPAFKDLMHEELIKRAELRGKENVVKERQAHTKLGLLGKTQAPKAGLTEAQDTKNKSYDQLLEDSMRELGIG